MKEVIILSLLGILGMGRCSKDELVNVALRGKAAQSSTIYGGPAKRAIDGIWNPTYEDHSCSHTLGETNPWWRVDLLETYQVTSVTITNRDTLAERINGAEIRIGNSLENDGNSNHRCALISSIPAGGSTTFQCHGMQGQYVNVFLRGYMQYLTLCEVEVNAHPAPIEEMGPTQASELNLIVPVTDNVALKKTTRQSSQYSYMGGSNNAVDGIRLSMYKDKSCSRTKSQVNPWWRVDLQRPYNVTSITVTNIEDVDPEMIDGAEIHIGNSLQNNGNSNPLCAVISSYPAWEVMTFQCSGIEGRYVNVFLPGCNKHLSLCEVEVNVGSRPDVDEHLSSDRSVQDMKRGQDILCPDHKTRYENAATGGIASQSSQWDKFGDANNAIDLNWTNQYLKGSCSHTKAEVDPWWRVDLSKTHNVTYVTITNRGDCCSDRISGAEIHVGDSLFNNGNSNPLCARIPYIPAGQSRTFPCGGISGRYVNILLPGKEKYLTLCEVEVQASTFQAGLPSTDPETAVRAPNLNLAWLWDLLRSLGRSAIRKETYNQNNTDEETFDHEKISFETQHPVDTVPENLASGGIAVHSSQYDSHGAASNAIDRKRNPLYHAGSCSHTEAETNPWWRVDLLDIYQVTFVTITNRGDCCLHRINGAEIRIGNSLENNGTTNPLCAVISEMGEGQPMDIPCNMEGHYVTIVLPGREKYLALCEVEVYGGK
ncbi:uncharacterized protein LOC129857689 isoform X3 [Salvelinus fontinalis]|uniref:uncharacterized protein LOC129857689 isoform X3 n=1 Tax=Salvelinus fontinalis TaxID=8038 RepID=UPI002485E1F2|nr:uncharacterized protein LOC129857689 isoform X3 [Salvelinus fontinalis]